MLVLVRTGILLAVLAQCMSAARPLPVILDTDIGDDIDDALALGLALQSPELNVLAVNTVLQHGDRRADLVWKILELYGRTDVPVGVGAEQPLMAPLNPAVVRQTELLDPAFHMPAAKRHNGLELLIETCLRSPEKVTIVAYGPLTNIALALRAEPRLREKVERIVLMNGVFFRAGLEYNTKMDPEASHIVYSSGFPVTTVGLDVTMQCRLSADHMRRLSESTLASAQFLLKLIRVWQNGNESQMPILHDPLSIAITIKPDLVSFATGRVDVETHGTPEQTYGMTVFHKDAEGKVRVANEVNSSAVVDLFLERLLAPPRPL